jgi:hypothetical protein
LPFYYGLENRFRPEGGNYDFLNFHTMPNCQWIPVLSKLTKNDTKDAPNIRPNTNVADPVPEIFLKEITVSYIFLRTFFKCIAKRIRSNAYFQQQDIGNRIRNIKNFDPDQGENAASETLTRLQNIYEILVNLN